MSMKMDELKELIINLELTEKETIYTTPDGIEVFVYKPLKPSATLKHTDYNPQKNFQIYLKFPEKKEFRPNHLRLLLDLHLKRLSDENKSNIIFSSLEKIYEGEDPEKFADKLKELNFRMQLDSSLLNVYYGQLFMIEQDINWSERKTQCQPPRSYLMGYIRMVHSGEKEIDRLLWSATRNPPSKKWREEYRCE